MSTTDYTIAEEVTLPSKGLIYDGKVRPTIKLRSMTGRDELKRQAPTNTPLKKIADIIEDCMIDKPGISVYDMSSGDYEFLLHKLRIISYGTDFKVKVICPVCGETTETVYNLENLKVKNFDAGEFENLRTLTLPKTGKTVRLKFQTPHSVEIIENNAKDMKRRAKNAEIDFNTFAMLNYVIDTVDGDKLAPFEQEDFINKLPAADMIKILNTLDKVNSYIGIESEIVIPCCKCGTDINTFFRFGTEFFRPSDL